MNHAGVFYYTPGPPFATTTMPAPGPPFATAAMPAPAAPYAPPAACYPAVPMQPAPAAWYPAVPVQQAAPPRPSFVPVHAVWAHNLDAFRSDIGYFAAHAHCVAVKVHYPGAGHDLTEEKRYATVKGNVDALKPLQVGLAICTDNGGIGAWEFNLSGFDPAVDPYEVQSLLYLQSRGLSCLDHSLRGIPMEVLTRFLRCSGLFSRRPGVSWITHTGAYHLGFLMKVLNGGKQLASDITGFFADVGRSLGDEVYDVARMAADCRDMPVGLDLLARRLALTPPLSTNPLAGAGTVLALQAFMKLRSQAFHGNVTRYRGVLQGLHAA